jgi:hypothetical protein
MHVDQTSSNAMQQHRYNNIDTTTLNSPSALVCLSSHPENMRTVAGIAASASSRDMVVVGKVV